MIVLDDQDSKNEGDLIAAAELITPETVDFHAAERGAGCCVPDDCGACDAAEALPRRRSRVEHLAASDAVPDPVDHRDAGTGVSTQNRVTTLRSLADVNSKPTTFCVRGT